MNMVVTFVFGCCVGLVLGAGLILWAAWMDKKHGEMINQDLWEEMEVLWKEENNERFNQ